MTPSESSQGSDCEASWSSGFVLAATACLGCAFAIQKLRAFDYWWHLRTGQLIAETGSVPKADLYSYTAEGARWIDIHWLFQLGMYRVFELGGHDAVVIAKAVFVVALLGLLAPIGWRSSRAAISGLALSAMLLIAGDRFMPRPELPSFVLLAALLLLFERHERKPDAWVFAALGVQLIWVNLHGLFAVGLVICAIYAAAELLRPVLQPNAGLRPDRLMRLCAVAVGSVLVSLLNPNFLEGALYPIQQLGMIGSPEERGYFGSLISELIPPLSGDGSWNPLQRGLVIGLSAASFGAMALNWRRLNGAHLLLWVAFGYLALGARRNLALQAIVYAPIVVVNLNEFLDRHPMPQKLRSALAWTSVAVISLLCFDVARGSFFPRIGGTREPGLGISELFYPSGAVEWIARERPPGPIFHHMADGGYLIWALYPDYRVMSDGRLEVYGPERFQEFQAGRPDQFRRLDGKFHFGTVLLHYSLVHSDELLRWLRLNSNWQLVFVDEGAAVFVRVPLDRPSPWPALDVDEPDLFADRPGTSPLIQLHLAAARTSFYAALGRYERALEEWEPNRLRHPNPRTGDVVYAMLLANTGKTAAAEAILARLLEDDPDDAALLSQIADIHMATGDLDRAGSFYDRALISDPQLVYAVLRRGVVAERHGQLADAALYWTQVLAIAPALTPVWLEAQARLNALPKY